MERIGPMLDTGLLGAKTTTSAEAMLVQTPGAAAAVAPEYTTRRTVGRGGPSDDELLKGQLPVVGDDACRYGLIAAREQRCLDTPSGRHGSRHL